MRVIEVVSMLARRISFHTVVLLLLLNNARILRLTVARVSIFFKTLLLILKVLISNDRLKDIINIALIRHFAICVSWDSILDE